jgi:hypothetical protein
MARRRYDPLDCIPSPEIVREKLRDIELLAERLRILLEVSERIHTSHCDRATGKAVQHAS